MPVIYKKWVSLENQTWKISIQGDLLSMKIRASQSHHALGDISSSIGHQKRMLRLQKLYHVWEDIGNQPAFDLLSLLFMPGIRVSL